jgi:hypothetical protein
MKIICKICNKELEVFKSHSIQSCHCSNETCVRIDRYGQPIITANDLTKVQMVDAIKPSKKTIDKPNDMQYTRRVPRKLDFEIR